MTDDMVERVAIAIYGDIGPDEWDAHGGINGRHL